jgi:putative transport protein
VEYLKEMPGATDALVAEPVVGYSIAYPVSVLGMIVVIYVAQRLWKVDYAAEAHNLHNMPGTGQELQNRTILVTRPEATEESIGEMVRGQRWDVLFGRHKRGEHVSLSGERTFLEVGDLVSVVGTTEELDRVEAALGEASDEELALDRTEIDYRRIFVSNPRVAGHRLKDLNLPQQYGAVVTRVRRGDIELLPHGDTVLELGDRVRVVSNRDHLPALTKFFGDSYRAVSEIDILSFSLGLALGMLLGLVPFPLPGGITLKLGLAGGPLVVALVLGALERTGPIVWSLPYSASLMLRQVGLMLFLAGIGTRAGYQFFQTLTQGDGPAILLASVIIGVTTSLLTLWIGHKLLKIPMSLMIGMLAGLQTQPATLGFALEQTHNELPNVGYATVFPFAMISKIVVAQVLLTLLL